MHTSPNPSRLTAATLLWAACSCPSIGLAQGAVETAKPGNGIFQDVLDTPAGHSPIAGRVLYNGLARAGQRVVGVGQRGIIVTSEDNGVHWIQASVPVSSDLTAVCFPSPKMGWAVGHDGVVLHSQDGGLTWAKQFDGRAAGQVMASHHQTLTNCAACHEKASLPPVKAGSATPPLMEEIKGFTEKGPDKPFLDVWFENEQTGYIVGAFNLIFRTTDGGRTWQPLFDRTDNPKRFHLYAIRAVGTDLYVCGEQGLLLRLDRQSGRFAALATPYKGTFFGLVGNNQAVVAYGLRGNAVRSADGGKRWEKVETGLPIGLTGGATMPDGRMVLVNQTGQVLISDNNGATFRPLPAGQPFPASSVLALDNGTLLLAGIRGMKTQAIK